MVLNFLTVNNILHQVCTGGLAVKCWQCVLWMNSYQHSYQSKIMWLI